MLRFSILLNIFFIIFFPYLFIRNIHLEVENNSLTYLIHNEELLALDRYNVYSHEFKKCSNLREVNENLKISIKELNNSRVTNSAFYRKYLKDLLLKNRQFNK